MQFYWMIQTQFNETNQFDDEKTHLYAMIIDIWYHFVNTIRTEVFVLFLMFSFLILIVVHETKKRCNQILYHQNDQQYFLVH